MNKPLKILEMHNVVGVKPRLPYPIYGFAVDETNSDPYGAVEYIEDSANFIPATNPSVRNFDGGSWLDKFPFNKIRPVTLNADGSVAKVVKETDFSVDANGEALTGESASRVMIEIPPVYWNFKKTLKGYEVRWAERKVNDNYHAYAHERGGVLKGNLYVGVYEGYVISNKLCSQRNYGTTTSTKLADFRTYANAHGDGYELMNYHTMTLLQILFVGMFKSLNSQLSLGHGNSSGNSALIANGTMDAEGMYYGDISLKTVGMKFIGIENLWSNARTWIDGFYMNSGTITINDGSVPCNNTGTGYPIVGVFPIDITASAYPIKVFGTNVMGFYPEKVGGSNTTYYCDQYTYSASTTTNRGLTFGGYYAGNLVNGIFCVQTLALTTSNTYVSARLQYLAP